MPTLDANTARPTQNPGDDKQLRFRLPPRNDEAEQSLLGAILTNNKAYERVSEFLEPKHFADPVHARIFESIAKLLEKGQLASPVTLKSYLEADGFLSEVGGPQYLARLAASAVTIINTLDYGRLIYDLYLRRQLIGLGEDMVNEAFAPDLDVSASDQIEQAEQHLFELASSGNSEGGFQDFNHAMAEAIRMAEAAHQREGKLSGVPTGLVDMDHKLGGLHPSDLIILAGRPSMGKTALATNIAFNAAKLYREALDEFGRKKVADGAVVAFFSLEMSAEQLATRILSEQTGIPSHKIRQGELHGDDFTALVAASQELQRLKLFIDDTPALTVSAVRTRARRLARTHGLGMIVIDYLQLLRASAGTRQENRVQEISDITRNLKALAKELSVPVVALSQLSRAVEQREDKRPQLADLRESGSIEQDADVVMFVFREQYYLERAEPTRRPDEAEDKFNDRHDRYVKRMEEVWNTAEVIIAKQRHGPIGTIKLFFDGNTTKFSDLAQSDHVPEHHD
ncbi:MAG: replicative DNA helicase [Alphaproteobacteria bacterium]|nr:replicative DNA helicase [Alphaproteobacteria bacterium]